MTVVGQVLNHWAHATLLISAHRALSKEYAASVEENFALILQMAGIKELSFARRLEANAFLRTSFFKTLAALPSPSAAMGDVITEKKETKGLVNGLKRCRMCTCLNALDARYCNI